MQHTATINNYVIMVVVNELQMKPQYTISIGNVCQLSPMPVCAAHPVTSHASTSLLPYMVED